MKKNLLLFGTALLMLLPMKAWSQTAYAWLSEDGKTFTFCYDDQKSSREGTTYYLSSSWYEDTKNVETVIFNSEFANVKPTSTKNWFRNMSKITEIPTISYLNTSSVSNMSYMFSNCQALQVLDLSTFDTGKVRDMSHMFDCCYGLMILDISNFNTSNVTTMAYMFWNCQALTSLDLSNLNTDYYISSLGITSSYLKFTTSMFEGCNNLTYLDVSNLNMSEVTSSVNMFKCPKLHTLKISPTMGFIDDNACNGVGTADNPCMIDAPEDFDFGEGVDTSGDYFLWKAGYFKSYVYELEIVISSAGVATFCYDKDLDFSGVTDYKAYVVNGYNSNTGNVTLVRVSDVPAGTGLILRGTAGNYKVPVGESKSLFANYLIGTTEVVTIQPTEGNKTNLVLSSKNGKVGFYPISSAREVGANKAYLQLPTSVLSANGMGLEFEDGTTDIDGVEAEIQPDVVWYTIDARRLDAKPTQKGLYIANGRKVVVP